MRKVDVVIVGGGPSGLTAALFLGRCRWNVLVIDAGQPRNAASHALHGFPSRDGMSPREFLEVARAQLRSYPSIDWKVGTVRDVEIGTDGIRVHCSDGSAFHASKVLLATGINDVMPDIPGIADLLGRGVFHCAYCDGWEVRDKALVVHAEGAEGAELAIGMLNWSSQVTLCTHGPARLGTEDWERLGRHGVKVVQDRIAGFEANVQEKLLRTVLLEGGRKLPAAAFFYSCGFLQSPDLEGRMRCKFTPKGQIEVNIQCETSAPGIYAAGDACMAVNLVVAAAGRGAQAAHAINSALVKERRP